MKKKKKKDHRHFRRIEITFIYFLISIDLMASTKSISFETYFPMWFQILCLNELYAFTKTLHTNRSSIANKWPLLFRLHCRYLASIPWIIRSLFSKWEIVRVQLMPAKMRDGNFYLFILEIERSFNCYFQKSTECRNFIGTAIFSKQFLGVSTAQQKMIATFSYMKLNKNIQTEKNLVETSCF